MRSCTALFALLCLLAASAGVQAKSHAVARKGSASAVSHPHRRRLIEGMDEEDASECLEECKEECSMAEEQERIKERDTHMAFVMGLLALTATYTLGFILETKHIHWIPEAAVGVIMGVLVALIAKYSGSSTMLQLETFDFEFFMTWLLPPIIFEAGYNMNVSAFFANIGPTMLYAFLGTFMSTFVVGGLVWKAGELGWCYPLPMLPSLVFGSLISATDPVTVLAVFQALGVKVDLFSMVFGESVLNDAVAIVLSRTLLKFIHTPVSTAAVIDAVGSFCTIFAGSMVIGAVAGVACALLFKHLKMKEHHDILFLECVLSFTFPWAAYYLSEGLELSGIVTILFCGIVMATYARPNLSDVEPHDHDHAEDDHKKPGGAAALTARVYKCLALVAETYVFVYLGMAMVTFPIFDHTTIMLVIVAIMACFVGRLHIYIFSILTNCFRDASSHPGPISGTYMHIMWFSGLRGGVAFALASVSYAGPDFPASHCADGPDCESLGDDKFSDSLAILQTTMLIAVFTIFVFGGSITSVCKAGGVLEKKGFKHVSRELKGAAKTSHNYLLKFLTSEQDYVEESHVRFNAALDGEGEPSVTSAASFTSARDRTPSLLGGSHDDSKSFRSAIGSKEVEMVLHGTGLDSQNLSVEDKLDEMRAALPYLGGSALKKMLDEAGGDEKAAIAKAKGGAATKELL